VTTYKPLARVNFAQRIITALIVAVPAWILMSPALAQQPAHLQHQDQGKSAQASAAAPGRELLVDELSELRAKIARIEAALEVEHRETGATSNRRATPDMKMHLSDVRMRRGPAATAQEAGSGATAGMAMRRMGKAGMAMMGKPKMGPMGSASGMMVSALPGVPGASHIYHVGSTGFFLDHAEHITLTTEQQAALNRLKEKALLEQATAQRKIDEIEQQLWVLTGSGKPDATKIRAKLGEVEKLRADQRFDYIRAVGEAATVLTEPQRRTLLGLMSANSAE